MTTPQPESAKNPELGEQDLLELMTSKRNMVRVDVAEHPNVSSFILAQLASDRYWMVRAKVASNPNTNHHTMMELADDKSPYVVTYVIRQQHDPKARGAAIDNLRSKAESLRNYKIATWVLTIPAALYILQLL